MNIKKIFNLALIAFLLTACNLNRGPQDYIDVSKSLSTLEGLKWWDNGTTILLRSRLFGGSATVPQEAQADMLNQHIMHGWLGEFHSWQRLKADDNTIKGLYQSYYVALSDIHTFMEGISRFDVSKEADPKAAQALLDTYLGRLHFARAACYFNLAIRWGQTYKEESATSDLCVPLLKKNDPLTKYPRATNKEVYDFILEDLDKAINLLSNTPGREGADFVSLDVVVALKARVYLYMGKMAEALATSEELINSGRYSLIGKDEMDSSGATALDAMWHLDTGREQIFQPHISKPDELPGTIGLYSPNLEGNRWWRENKNKDIAINTPPYLPAGWVKDFYEEGDKRYSVYFEKVSTIMTTLRYDATFEVTVISKFKGNKAYADLTSNVWGGYVPNDIQAPKPFRYAEQVLIAMEAAQAIGDDTKALDYLNRLRESRGLVAKTGLVGDNLRQEIRDERTRELAYEGFRLWDLRRWGLGMQRHNPQDERVLSKEYDLNLSIPANDYRFVWAIPQMLFKINHNLVQNEGWEK